MVHGHNERLVSVSFVFAKDGSAVLVHRQNSIRELFALAVSFFRLKIDYDLSGYVISTYKKKNAVVGILFSCVINKTRLALQIW